MSFGDAVSSCFRKYATFAGRARRSEFWWWTVFACTSSLAATFLDGLTGRADADGTGTVPLLVALVLVLPSVAVAVRRLHDTDRSGWFVVLGVVPVVGAVIVLALCAQDGVRANTIHGCSPKHRWPTTSLSMRPSA